MNNMLISRKVFQPLLKNLGITVPYGSLLSNMQVVKIIKDHFAQEDLETEDLIEAERRLFLQDLGDKLQLTLDPDKDVEDLAEDISKHFEEDQDWATKAINYAAEKGCHVNEDTRFLLYSLLDKPHRAVEYLNDWRMGVIQDLQEDQTFKAERKWDKERQNIQNLAQWLRSEARRICADDFTNKIICKLARKIENGEHNSEIAIRDEKPPVVGTPALVEAAAMIEARRLVEEGWVPVHNNPLCSDVRHAYSNRASKPVGISVVLAMRKLNDSK